ncbi:MAG: hypothetical protein WD509_01945 [Candidatus Paceibacterota bacterium]
MKEKIQAVRTDLDNAFRHPDVANRNKMIISASEILDELENSQEESEIVKNVRVSYSRELIESLEPSNFDNDILSFIALKRLNPMFNSILEQFPALKARYDRFMESLRSDDDFIPFLDLLKR